MTDDEVKAVAEAIYNATIAGEEMHHDAWSDIPTEYRGVPMAQARATISKLDEMRRVPPAFLQKLDLNDVEVARTHNELVRLFPAVSEYLFSTRMLLAQIIARAPPPPPTEQQ